MNLLLLGEHGQIGWELRRSLLPLGKIIGLNREGCDLTDGEAIRRAVRDAEPGVIVNAAAYTDVDGAESEPELAFAVNATAPGILAEEAEELGAILVHYSTDYVFDGSAGHPYIETDEPNPINTYGLSKLKGEEAIRRVGGHYVILRTSWVYSLRRPCFVRKVLSWKEEKDEIRAVDDQFGSPTWCRLASLATCTMLVRVLKFGRGMEASYRGVFHLAGSGGASRFDLARAVLDLTTLSEDPAKRTPTLHKARSAEFSSTAARPKDTRLDVNLFESTFGFSIPNWKESLRLALRS